MQGSQRVLSVPGCSTPAAVTEAVDRMAEVAPQVQDDFDLQEGVLAELELQDRPENQVPWHTC